MHQLNEQGLPARRVADFVIGAPSLYARKQPLSTSVATRSEGAGIRSVAYDDVHHRLLTEDRNRLLLFDAHPDTITNGADALAVFGQPGFNDRLTTGVGPQRLGSINSALLDDKNQRLFVSDARNNRIMVWDIHPDRLTPTPAAMAVLGQQDFDSNEPAAGASGLNTPGDLFYDYGNDRLFVADSGNHRVLVFDARPGQIGIGAPAMTVIGQTDFDTVTAGVGATRLNGPGALMYDPSHQRLFVGDEGNHRILIFDAAPQQLENGMAASYVFGQDDFNSNAPRTDLKKAMGELRYMQIDPIRQRLYATEPISLNRALVFDVHPDRITNNPDAISVLFQDSADDIDAMVSRSQETWPRPDVLDPFSGKLYSAASHPGGNRITIFDVSGDLPLAGLEAVDVLGHVDGDGNPDFESRAAAGRANGRVFYPRSLALDPIDHRLFVGDQYNNRVLMYQLDRENRVLSRDATIVFGQPDNYTVKLHEISRRTLKIPFGLAYDPGEKRLFIGDGWHNRVMVFDAHPDRLHDFPEAIAVLGQPDFTTLNPGASGPDRFDFKMTHPDNRNIGGGGTSALAMVVDPNAQRLFLSDGGNNRVLVFDIRPDQLRPGAAAVSVIGQPDFEAREPTLIPESVTAGADRSMYARGFNSPAGLAFDEQRNRLFVVDGLNSRVLVFDVTPGRVENNMTAIGLIGQKDFASRETVRLAPDLLPPGGVPEEVGRRRMYLPSSVAYDPVNDWLYVGDRGNERTLVFDARPENLEPGSDPAALHVFGKDDFVSDVVTIAEQEEIIEPREMAVDSEHQRLYQTDTPMARVLLFDLPQSERSVSLPARAMTIYSTTDPWNGRNRPDREREESGVGALLTTAGPEAPGASLVLAHTRQYLDPKSERRSRVLISETTLLPPVAVSESSFYIDQQQGIDHVVLVSNTSGSSVEARLEFQASGARSPTEVTRQLSAGGQLELRISELFGPSVAGRYGRLRISSNQPLAAAVVRQIETVRGESLSVAVPMIEPFQAVEPFAPEDGSAIAALDSGGGYDSQIVLVNYGNERSAGEIEVRHARTGEPVSWLNGGNALPWEMEAGGVFRFTLESPSPVPEELFAVITTESGAAPPWAAGIVSLRNGELLLTQTMIGARPRTSLAWFAVDTMPNLIRHSQTPAEIEFSLANPSQWPALVRFTLFDLDGNEKGRHEQIMEPNTQRRWSLADLFNLQQFRGSVRMWSDIPVAVSGRRLTTSLRGERVENEIGYTDVNASRGAAPVALPAIWDGNGMATEIMLVNPGTSSLDSELRFNSSGGAPQEIVLR